MIRRWGQKHAAAQVGVHSLYAIVQIAKEVTEVHLGAFDGLPRLNNPLRAGRLRACPEEELALAAIYGLLVVELDPPVSRPAKMADEMFAAFLVAEDKEGRAVAGSPL